jgi:hypothetical protein
MSSRPVIGQVALSSALNVQRGEGDPATALRPNANVGIFLQAIIQGSQRLAHLVLQLTDETIGIEGEIQRLVVFIAVRVEIGRQILLRIAISIGADHPDFLAA